MPETPPPAAPSPVSAPPSSAAPTKDEMNMAFLLYILALFTGFIGPLIIWMMKKEQSAYLDAQGKEVLNWCITVFLAQIASAVLIMVFIGVLLLPLVVLAHIVLTILGALKVKEGQPHRYPFALRLLK